MSNHLKAVEKAIRAGKVCLTDAHAPLVELCRTLARQMDDTPEPSTRLTASYLSALKDLGRVLATIAPASPKTTSSLARLRALQQKGEAS